MVSTYCRAYSLETTGANSCGTSEAPPQTELQELDATVQVWGCRECLGFSLGLGAGDEPVQSLRVRLRGQTSTADIAIGVCYRPPEQEGK